MITPIIIATFILAAHAATSWQYEDANRGAAIPTPPFPNAQLKFKLRGSQTNNFISVIELDFLEAGPGNHLHTREDEFYYVLDGQVQFMINGTQFCGKTGDYVYVPRLMSRAVRVHNPTHAKKRVRMQIALFPAGVEGFLEDIAVYFIQGHNNQTLSDEISRKYGLRNLEPVIWEDLGCFQTSR